MCLSWGSELSRPACGSQAFPGSSPPPGLGFGEGEEWVAVRRRAGMGFGVS